LITPLYEDFIEGPFDEVFRDAMLEVNGRDNRVKEERVGGIIVPL
jgi:hypothetical protein